MTLNNRLTPYGQRYDFDVSTLGRLLGCGVFSYSVRTIRIFVMDNDLATRVPTSTFTVESILGSSSRSLFFHSFTINYFSGVSSVLKHFCRFRKKVLRKVLLLSLVNEFSILAKFFRVQTHPSGHIHRTTSHLTHYQRRAM